MNQFEFDGKKPSMKKLLTSFLCCCMLATSVDMGAFATEADAASVETGSGVVPALTGAMTPDEEVFMTPDNETLFGAYALSASTFYKQTGDNVTMKVHAWTQTGAISYTWYKPDGTELTEVTGDTLTVENLQPGATNKQKGDFGKYLCVVSDGTYRKKVTFKVNKYSSLYATAVGSSSREYYDGEQVNLAVEAYDANNPESKLTYRWYRQNERIECTDSSYSFTYEGNSGYMNYYCEVSNGKDTKKVHFWVGCKASLEYVDPGASPNRTVLLGSRVTLEALEMTTDNPYATVSYQWYKNGEAIAGATDRILEITAEVSATYYCEATAGSESVQAYSVYVIVVAQAVSGWGNYITCKQGDAAELKIENLQLTEGITEEQLKYQWYDGRDMGSPVKLEGETGKTLVFQSVDSADAGNYQVEVSWGDTEAEKILLSAYLDVMGKMDNITMEQSAYAAAEGETITYTMVSRDGSPLPAGCTFRWYESGEEIEGAVTGSYETQAAAGLDLRCEVTCGEESQQIWASGVNIVEKDSANWMLGFSLMDETYVTQTITYNKRYDEEIELKIPMAKGDLATPEITWEKQGIEYEILAEKGTSYKIRVEDLQGDEQFHATITDGTKTADIYWYINQESTLRIEEYNWQEKASDGDTVTFEVEASTTLDAEITYQWEKRTIRNYDDWTYEAIDGATGSELKLENITAEDYGVYRCRITDGNMEQAPDFYLRRYSLYTTQKVEYIRNNDGSNKAVLHVDATYEDADKPITYTWAKYVQVDNWNDCWEYLEDQEAGGNTYTIGNTKSAESNIYMCEVSAGGNSAQSIFELSDSGASARFKGTDSSSMDLRAEIGKQVALHIVAENADGSDVKYRWEYYDGDEDEWKVIPGATTELYTVQVNDVAAYGKYRCVATIDGVEKRCTATVSKATYGEMNVRVADSYQRKKILSIVSGETVTLASVACCDGHELSYTWTQEGYSDNGMYEEVIPGADQSSYTFVQDDSWNIMKYYCEVTCESCKNSETLTYELQNKDYFDLDYIEDGFVYVREGEDVQLQGQLSKPDGSVINLEEYTFEWSNGGKVNEEGEIEWKSIGSGQKLSYEISNISKGEYGNYRLEVRKGSYVRYLYYYVDEYSNGYYADDENGRYRTVAEGESVTFAPVLRNDESQGYLTEGLSYTWYWKAADNTSSTWTECGQDATYRIDSFTMKDLGSYKCDILYNGEIYSISYELELDTGFVWIDDSGESGAYSWCLLNFAEKAGTVVTLDAYAESYYSVDYTWYVLDEQGEPQVIPYEKGSAYTFTHKENSTYWCEARDAAGVVRTKLFYVNMDSYEDDECRISLNSTKYVYTPELNHPVTLEVNVTKSESTNLNVSWYKENDGMYLLVKSGQDRSYQIPQMTEDAYYDRYLAVISDGIEKRACYYSFMRADFRTTLENMSGGERDYFDDIYVDRYAYKSSEPAEALKITFGETVYNSVIEEMCLYEEDGSSRELYDISGRSVYVQGDRFVIQIMCWAGEYNIPIESIEPVQFSLNSMTETIQAGNTVTLKVEGITGETEDIEWSSSNKVVAAVSDGGVVKAKRAGSAVITAEHTASGLKAECTVTVTDNGKDVRVTSVGLSSTSLTLNPGKQATLTATVLPLGASVRGVSWSSSNEKVATVENGVVAAKAYGTAEITVITEDGGKTAKCTVNVVDPAAATVFVTGVTLSQPEVKLKVNETKTLTAQIVPTNAANKTLTWTSSDSSVVSVSATGVMKALKKGTATITVTTVDGRKTASCKVTVIIPAQKVLLVKKMTMAKGQMDTLVAFLVPAESNDNITWTTSNDKVVTVDANGKVKAVGTGTAKVTAVSSSGKKAVCSITVVKKKVKITKIKFAKRKLTMDAGKTMQLNVNITPKNGTEDLIWSSSKKSVATVDSNGCIRALKAGTTTIKVKTSGGKVTTCKLVVKQPAQSVKLNKKSATMKVNQTMKLKAVMTPKKATDKLVWTSSNPKLAKVDAKGTVTAVKKGKVTITVKTQSGKKAICQITIK